MIHASLFSGIGGPEVAAAMMGWTNAFHCEINPFGRAVLEYWFPESKSYEDITKTDFHEWRGKIDVLTGGFPCQPFSYAGKRGGREDERYLWPQMLRAIDEIRPAWVVGENVTGITTMVEGGVLTDMGCSLSLFQEGDDVHRYELDQSFTIERICRDLERIGYSVQPVLVPAAAVGAPHRRDRVFIIASENTMHNGCCIGADGKQGSERDERNVSTGDQERICGEARLDAPNSPCDGSCGISGEQGSKTSGQDGKLYAESVFNGSLSEGASPNPNIHRGCEVDEHIQSELADGAEPFGNGRFYDASNSTSEMRDRRCSSVGSRREEDKNNTEHTVFPSIIGSGGKWDASGYDWKTDRGMLPEKRWREFPTVSPVHRGNDGIPFDVDDLAISPSKWRTESLKAYGNAIVPQVMYRIFQAIEEVGGKQ